MTNGSADRHWPTRSTKSGDMPMLPGCTSKCASIANRRWAFGPQYARLDEQSGLGVPSPGSIRRSESPFTQALERCVGCKARRKPEHAEHVAEPRAAYQDQGRYAEAESLLTQAIEARRRVLGPEHPADAEVDEQPGAGVRESEEVRRRPNHSAPRCWRSATVLGAEPGYAKSINILATLYLAQGKFAEAEPLAHRGVGGHPPRAGPEHPQTIAAMNNLASLYRYQGKLAEAESLSIKVLEVARALRGPEHPETMISMNNLVAA